MIAVDLGTVMMFFFAPPRGLKNLLHKMDGDVFKKIIMDIRCLE